MPAHPRSPRILLTRLNDIGDCVMTLPVLNALRAHFRDAHLCWVVQSPGEQLLENHPALDRLILARRGWHKSPRAIWNLRRELRQERFDVALDLHGAAKTALLGKLSRARRRIGFARSADVSRLSVRLNEEHVSPRKTHQIKRQLELLRPLGIRAPEIKFDIPHDSDATRFVQSFIHKSHLQCGFVAINPGAGWRSRRWIPQRFGIVAKHLGQLHQVPSVVTWSADEERRWAEEIVARSGGHAVLAAQTTLPQLASLLRHAMFFVGCDAGPMHLAHAVGTDCVVLHGATRPECTGAFGRGHIAVQNALQSGTIRQLRRADNHAMQAIQAESVCRACDEMLARQTGELHRRKAA